MYSRSCKEETIGALCTLRWIRVRVKGLSFPPTWCCVQRHSLYSCAKNPSQSSDSRKTQTVAERMWIPAARARKNIFCHLKQSRQGSTSHRTLMSHLITPSAHLTSWHVKRGWQMYCQNTNLSTSSCKSTHRCFTVEIWGQTNILTYRVTL